MSQADDQIQKSLDDVLEELGTFGYFQLRLFCFILVGVIANAIYNAQYVFAAAAVPYRCLVPECESAADDEYETGNWSEWTLVPGSNCERYAPSSADAKCEKSAFTDTSQPCNAWIYKSNHTIVAEERRSLGRPLARWSDDIVRVTGQQWIRAAQDRRKWRTIHSSGELQADYIKVIFGGLFGLACRDWQRAIVGTAHNVGVFSALFFVGLLSDSIGRRATFTITATSSGFVGVARGFSNSYLMFVILEYIESVVGHGSYSTGYILAMEMMDPTKRVIAGAVMSSVFATGQIILGLTAWAVPYWRTQTIVLYAPAFVFIFYIFILEESVRWLLCKGKTDEAIAILLRAARYNKRHISPETLEHLAQAAEKSRNTPKVSAKTIFKEVIHSRIIRRRVLICCFIWTTTTLVYYGLSINSVSLGDNMYTSYIFMSLVEIPGYLMSMLLLDRLGRKISLMGAFILCGSTLVLIPVIPNKYAMLVLSLMAKACISMVFVGTYIFTLELFPTTARHTLMNMCSTIGRFGSISAPLTPLLTKYMESLPFLLFGLMSLIAAFLLVWAPETLHTRLPDTVLQAEAMHRIPMPAGSKHSKIQRVQENIIETKEMDDSDRKSLSEINK